MAITWKVVLTWQMTWRSTWQVMCLVPSAPQPICGWAQFCMDHQVGPNFNSTLITNKQDSALYTSHIKNSTQNQFQNKNVVTSYISSFPASHHITHQTTDHISFNPALSFALSSACFLFVSLDPPKKRLRSIQLESSNKSKT